MRLSTPHSYRSKKENVLPTSAGIDRSKCKGGRNMTPSDHPGVRTIAPAERRSERRPPFAGHRHDIAIARDEALVAQSEPAEPIEAVG